MPVRLKWQKLLLVDPGRWRMSVASSVARQICTEICIPDLHRGQAIIERFNRPLPERLSGFHYVREMRLRFGQGSTEWVVRLPTVVSPLNNETTRLTGKMPSTTIKAKTVAQKPSSVVAGHPVGLEEKNLLRDVGVHYHYQPGKLEGRRCRATDPVCPVQVYRLGTDGHSVSNHGEPVLYYLWMVRLEALSGRSCMWCF